MKKNLKSLPSATVSTSIENVFAVSFFLSLTVRNTSVLFFYNTKSGACITPAALLSLFKFSPFSLNDTSLLGIVIVLFGEVTTDGSE